MNNRRIVSAGLPALLAILTYASPGVAHPSISPAQAFDGQTVIAAITLPHGCDGASIDTVVIDLPEGFVGAKPQAKPGWDITIETGAYARSYDLHGSKVEDGPIRITWSGGNLPDQHFDTFVVRGSLVGFDAETALAFPTIQQCGSSRISWSEVPATAQDAHALEHPAPRMTVKRAAGTDLQTMRGPAPFMVTEAFARAMPPGAKVGGAFLTIQNHGSQPDRLIAVTSGRAGRVELHESVKQGDVMAMRPVEGGIEIPSGGSLELKPGGYHMMFVDVAEPFKQGQTVPVTLLFEQAGKVEVQVPVAGLGASEAPMSHMGH